MLENFTFPIQLAPNLTGISYKSYAHQDTQIFLCICTIVHKTIVIIVMFLIGKILLANYRRKNNM